MEKILSNEQDINRLSLITLFLEHLHFCLATPFCTTHLEIQDVHALPLNSILRNS